MTPHQAMHRIDALLSHVWMVRTFLKHSEEAEDDEQLMEIVRELYDNCLAVGPAWTEQNPDEYLKVIHKKYGKLRAATDQFAELQPEVSAHTNFKMAVRALQTAVDDIGSVMSHVER